MQQSAVALLGDRIGSALARRIDFRAVRRALSLFYLILLCRQTDRAQVLGVQILLAN